MPRSRLGCKACRKRRIKCTEERPKCTRCAKMEKECEYIPLLHFTGAMATRGKLARQNASMIWSPSPKPEDDVCLDVSCMWRDVTLSVSDWEHSLLHKFWAVGRFEYESYESEDPLGLFLDDIRQNKSLIHIALATQLCVDQSFSQFFTYFAMAMTEFRESILSISVNNVEAMLLSGMLICCLSCLTLEQWDLHFRCLREIAVSETFIHNRSKKANYLRHVVALYDMDILQLSSQKVTGTNSIWDLCRPINMRALCPILAIPNCLLDIIRKLRWNPELDASIYSEYFNILKQLERMDLSFMSEYGQSLGQAWRNAALVHVTTKLSMNPILIKGYISSCIGFAYSFAKDQTLNSRPKTCLLWPLYIISTSPYFEGYQKSTFEQINDLCQMSSQGITSWYVRRILQAIWAQWENPSQTHHDVLVENEWNDVLIL